MNPVHSSITATEVRRLPIGLGVFLLLCSDQALALEPAAWIGTYRFLVTELFLPLLPSLGWTLLAIGLTSLFWWRRQRRLKRRLHSLQGLDELTGLPNHNALIGFFNHELKRAQRFGRPLSVILLDLDDFDKISREHGPMMGNRVLIELSELLRDGLRDVDKVFRWEAERFLVVCTEAGIEEADLVGERILLMIRNHDFPIGWPLRVSTGVASATAYDNLDTLIERAGQSLAEARLGPVSSLG